MTASPTGGLVRPNVSAADAVQLALECFGLVATATELGSNQDRNFLLTQQDGTRYVLRIDHPVFTDAEREAQHAALAAYRSAGVAVPGMRAGQDGALTQRWNGFAARLSDFVDGEPMVDLGYFAPVVLEEFGALAAASVRALSSLEHPGLDRDHMWVMAAAYAETVKRAPAIADAELQERVLDAVHEAQAALDAVVDALPVQPIHGDLTDDNVMGQRGDDARVHPHTVLDLGDLALGWRVAELAVTAASMLHHESDRPLRVLDTIAAFHRIVPLSEAEARAVWPLIVLRAGVLVASGWRQLEIDGDNDYARDRVAGEQAIFDAATALPLAEMTEHVLARLGMIGVAAGTGPGSGSGSGELLGGLLPSLGRAGAGSRTVRVLDVGVESSQLESGRWRNARAENALIAAALAGSAPVELGAGGEGLAGRAETVSAVVLPYGVARLTRTEVDSCDAGETWPIGAEIWLAAGDALEVATPAAATIAAVTERGVLLELSSDWCLAIDGFTPVGWAPETLASDGVAIPRGARLGLLSETTSPRALSVTLCRADAIAGVAAPLASLPAPNLGRAHLVSPERVPAWARFTADPAPLLGLTSCATLDTAADELNRRERIFASAQERYYERPMQIERGWRHHLVDTTGRAYIDLVNNVTGLGHGHPGVADAVNRQVRILNTNSRFLYRDLAEYSERLLALLPEGSGLDTVMLVNSGSEAVDLALRLAQAATGRQSIVSLREAYHGWTMASDAVTTSAYDNPNALATRPDWVHVADVPNRFRGTHRGAADDRAVGAAYAADLGDDLDRLAAEGCDIAGFICESVLGNAGGVLLPEGYLADAYGRVRAAGGLCIADEVQVGFGRMGSSFWGFEQSGVRPDIITIAKPMGNGFPIGGVITSQRVADALATQGQFFSSAGGNPLSCRVGLAVLDAMENEGLQENARVVGAHLAAGFRALAQRHDIIGPVHGEGLYLGVELVRDRSTLDPATAEAAAICERMKELGVIVLTTSERSNVLKVKPPLCLTRESADVVLAALDRVLSEGW